MNDLINCDPNRNKMASIHSWLLIQYSYNNCQLAVVSSQFAVRSSQLAVRGWRMEDGEHVILIHMYIHTYIQTYSNFLFLFNDVYTHRTNAPCEVSVMAAHATVNIEVDEIVLMGNK